MGSLRYWLSTSRLVLEIMAYDSNEILFCDRLSIDISLFYCCIEREVYLACPFPKKYGIEKYIPLRNAAKIERVI